MDEIKKEQERLDEIEKQVKKDREKVEDDRFFINIFHGILTCWQYQDPGKDSDSFFFLSVGKERVLVKNFVPDDKICKTRKEWDNYLEKASYYEKRYKREKVPYHYANPIVDFSEIAKDVCSKCSQQVPIIEHYVQTCDSFDGDTWMKRLLAVCVDCKKITEIKKEFHSHSF